MNADDKEFFELAGSRAAERSSIIRQIEAGIRESIEKENERLSRCEGPISALVVYALTDDGYCLHKRKDLFTAQDADNLRRDIHDFAIRSARKVP